VALNQCSRIKLLRTMIALLNFLKVAKKRVSSG
jgi:hypothetical protein